MSKYLIEVPHEGTKEACMRAIKVFMQTGSHFLTHAEWGCTDGEHKAWMIVEVKDKSAAKQILPSLYKMKAKITRLEQLSRSDLTEAVMEHHS
jgi:hypothetical protein